MIRRRLKVIGIVVLSLVAVGTVAALGGMAVVFRVARVEGQSMAPTIRDQDRLIVQKWAYRSRPPRRGDIVMLAYPKNPAQKFVMRVIAVEGDTVAIAQGRVILNHEEQPEPFIPHEFRPKRDWGPEVVPPNHYFVLGDHRNNSSDSRMWGWVPRQNIIGKVVYRWFPFSDARPFGGEN